MRFIGIIWIFITEVDKLRERNGLYSPVILTGDFNSNSNSPVYELMAKGKNYFNSAYTNNEINSEKKSRNLYDGGGGGNK